MITLQLLVFSLFLPQISFNQTLDSLILKTNHGPELTLKGEILVYENSDLIDGGYQVFHHSNTEALLHVYFLDRIRVSKTDTSIIFSQSTFLLNTATERFEHEFTWQKTIFELDSDGKIQKRAKITPEDSLPPFSISKDFEKNVCHLLNNPTEIPDSANSSILMGKLFFAALSDFPCSKELFLNLEEILAKEDLLKEYGGEPAQFHHEYRKIWFLWQK